MGTICVVLRLTLMTREVTTPSSVLSNLHCTPFKTRHKACWEVIAKEEKTCLLCCLICWQRTEQVTVSGKINISIKKNIPLITQKKSLRIKRSFHDWVLLSPNNNRHMCKSESLMSVSYAAVFLQMCRRSRNLQKLCHCFVRCARL